MEALHSRRTYDYRIQEAICETGDRDLFPELNIPRSTIRSWIHRGVPEVISSDLAAHDYAELAAEIERLRRRHGIGWSEKLAGDALENASILPNPKSASEQRLPGNFFIWT